MNSVKFLIPLNPMLTFKYFLGLQFKFDYYKSKFNKSPLRPLFFFYPWYEFVTNSFALLATASQVAAALSRYVESLFISSFSTPCASE